MIFTKILKKILGRRLCSALGVKFRYSKYRAWSRTVNGKASLASIAKLKNRHKGQRCFVVGNGPSLRQMDLTLLKNELSIGSNGIFLATESSGYKPTYYTIEDRLVGEDRHQEAADFSGPLKLFPYDLHYCLKDVPEALFFYFDRSAEWSLPKFGNNLEDGANWGGTVTFLNLQLARFLGCDPVYLIGVDHSYSDTFDIEKKGNVWTSKEDDQNHFAPSYFGAGYRWHNPNVARMELSYIAAKQHSENNNWSIYNATVGGKLEVFPRVHFTSIFKK